MSAVFTDIYKSFAMRKRVFNKIYTFFSSTFSRIRSKRKTTNIIQKAACQGIYYITVSISAGKLLWNVAVILISLF